jgi:hypothetical protein
VRAVIRTIAERVRFTAWLMKAELPLDVSAEPWKPTRSNQQNRYLFGVAYPLLAEGTGYEVDGDNGIHAFMCGTHFGWVDAPCPKTPQNPEGVCSKPRRTTTRDEDGRYNVIDKAAFSAFVKTVQRIGAAANVFIPDPEPSDG